jgi:8-oxo-dGTP pyrophosphatase MutT (NUDIX family)
LDFEPQKFFVGLMDFFSIWLPGAVLVFFFMHPLGPAVLGAHLPKADAVGWAVFLLASYVTGHMVFLLGSWLDDLYDLARSNTRDAQVTALAKRGRLLAWPLRVLVWVVFKDDRNLAVRQATALKRKDLAPSGAQGAINTFQWCKAVLALESTEGLGLVQRFEADSKFFRSFVVVLAVLIISWPWQDRWRSWAVVIAAALLVLALWRYMEERFKATRQAYWLVIALRARAEALRGAVADRQDTPGQDAQMAGGVVYRGSGPSARFLLVEATDDPQHWVLPKGHVEAGESLPETAIREVLEETGAWGRIEDELGESAYVQAGAPARVTYFLMQAVGRGARQDRKRRHRWLGLEDAIREARWEETKDMLRRGGERVI